jgi:copper chaperone CopZ
VTTPTTGPENTTLDLLDVTAAPQGSGCGCGGCGCGAENSTTETSSTETSTTETAEAKETPMTDQTTRSYAVTGMTCGHCTNAVTAELEALDDVVAVDVDVVAGGTSTVTVTSTTPLTEAQVADALDEAGDYQLA